MVLSAQTITKEYIRAGKKREDFGNKHTLEQLRKGRDSLETNTHWNSYEKEGTVWKQTHTGTATKRKGQSGNKHTLEQLPKGRDSLETNT